MFSEALSGGSLRHLEHASFGGLTDLDEVRILCEGLGSGKLQSLNSLWLGNITFGADEAAGWRVLSEVLVAEKVPCLQTVRFFSMSINDNHFLTLTEAWGTHQPPPLTNLRFVQTTPLSTNAVEALRTMYKSGRMPHLLSAELGHNVRVEII